MKNSKKIFFIFTLCLSFKAFTQEQKQKISLKIESNFDRALNTLAPKINRQLERNFSDPRIQNNPNRYIDAESGNAKRRLINSGINSLRELINEETDFEDRMKQKIKKTYNDFVQDEERDQVYKLEATQRSKEKSFKKTLESEKKANYKVQFRNRLYRGEARWLFETNFCNAELDARLLSNNKIRARLYTKKIILNDLGINIFGNLQYSLENGGRNSGEIIISNEKDWSIVVGNYFNDLGNFTTDNRMTFQYSTSF